MSDEERRDSETISNDRLLGAIDANVNRLVDDIKEVKARHVEEIKEARLAHTQAVRDMVQHLEKHFEEDDLRFNAISTEMKDVWKYINKALGMSVLLIVLLGVLGWLIPIVIARTEGVLRHGQNTLNH